MAATANSWKIGAGKWKCKWFPKTASTAIATGILLELSSGYLIEATTSAGASDTPVAGLYFGTAITSTSSNYTTAELLPVWVPADPMATAIGIVDTGTIAVTDLGKSFDISATNGITVSTTTNEPVTVVKVLDTTAAAGLAEVVLTNMSSPAA
jgi:hypothetical protein